ncbi:MAG: AarF/UbiB family protein, partial [Pseudomonadota bacterium]
MKLITPGQIFRVFSIQRVLIKHGVDELFFRIPLLGPVRFVLYLLPWNWFRKEQGPRGERIRLALEELGPIFVKLGQILSTRRDLLPDDIAIELSRLQDRVPPFPGAQAQDIIESALNGKVADLFASFDQTPLASASIAQVHAATLKDGREVIVKVVRPNIKTVIERDVALMNIL